MAAILDQINQELVGAMRQKEEVRVSTLRLLLAAFKNRQIELGHELSDEEVLDVIAKNGKQHKESIEAYKKGGRDDLVKREEAELEILGKYMPEQMNEQELEKIVVETISEVGATTKADTGKVMSAVMAKVKGKADGSIVSGIVGGKLA